jgi:probable HAF family extracellular repeat protein
MADLGTLGGSRSVAYAINPRGDVVGSSTIATGVEHAVLWPAGGDDIIDLGTLGAQSVATGINASRQIVGYFSGPPSGGAFLWQNGVMTELPGVLLEIPGEPLPPGSAHAYAINAAGDVVGDGRTFLTPHAALWTRK